MLSEVWIRNILESFSLLVLACFPAVLFSGKKNINVFFWLGRGGRCQAVCCVIPVNKWIIGSQGLGELYERLYNHDDAENLFFSQTAHKKTFYYLEQLILKHKLHQNSLNIKEIHGRSMWFFIYISTCFKGEGPAVSLRASNWISRKSRKTCLIRHQRNQCGLGLSGT